MTTALAWRAAAAVLALAPATASAEEGMWTFDDVPVGRVERSLGVRLEQPWLDHLRGASVRLTTGCSGAVVSRAGLVLTNHHCVMACAENLSSAGRDYLRDGFVVDGRREERTCPGVEAEILEGITDITGAVFAASAGKFGADFVAAREQVISRGEREVCRGDPALRCQVIGFFGGGQFKVYKYRVYDDVRLAFAPEYAAAFFGGDPDNFTFPRFDLDFALLRLYEGGAPARPAAWLTWSTAAPRAGEAVFVAGNPGSTQRAFTVAQLESERDIAIPADIAQRIAVRDALIAFARGGPEQARLAQDPIFVQENTLKLILGRRAALADPAFLDARRKEEGALRARVAVDRKLAARIGDPWAEIAGTRKTWAGQYLVWRQLESGAGGGSSLFAWARTLVRGAAERARASSGRLPEFADSRLPMTQKALLDERPTNPELERLYLTLWLGATREALGAGTTADLAFLGSESPAALAARLVAKTRLADPAVRRALWLGGMPAILASDDPLIAYVVRTDPLSRAAREIWEDEVIGPSDRALERIARVRVAVEGADLYPDATFSLRLSYGKVAGWTQGGVKVAPFTSFGGLYARATGAPPFALPERWLAARAAVDPARVLDFVTTNDIVAGNSGSPVVNARGQIVGDAFDGNLPSIAGDFAYDPTLNRTVAVSTVAIGEALSRVYGQDALLRELEGR
ncbi:MAG: S46 family peptidase [Caulobacteraceae bacterium]